MSLDQKTQQIQKIIHEIEAHTTADNWSVPMDYLLAFIDDCRREDYLRYWYHIYNQGNRAPLASIDELRNTFEPCNVGALVQFLEWKGFVDVSHAFYAAGYYLDPLNEIKWLEVLQSLCLHCLHNHEVERELLEVALAGCQNFQDAVEFYYHSKFTMAELTDYAMRIYFQNNSIREHSYSQHLLRNSAQSKLHSHGFFEQTLVTYFSKRLWQKCVEWQISDIDMARVGQNQKIPAPVQQALSELGLPPRRLPSRATLRKRYCALLKKYHPDLQANKNETLLLQKIMQAYQNILTAYYVW